MATVPADIGSTLFTYRDLEGTPDDGRTYELSHGTLVVTPAANTEHGRLVARLVRVLGEHLGTPALVVEVLSPPTAVLDRTEKRHVYAEAGIPAYWLVDPDTRTITVLELEGGANVERAVLDATGRCEVTSPTSFVLEAAAVYGA